MIHKFVGSALAQFERSTLPEHQGTKTIVLRFLKIITPATKVTPSYDDYICCPKEGELYRRVPSRGREKNHQVWSIDADKVGSRGWGFRLLWDT